ncbi:MAG TPA: efflux RND transporter periplasmic adaptor subunit [Alphaproteobacteria bacterium]|nr:efflux RND transporter periplasmic adaptor subunit [Alphaproteobacteria bacterium]
MRPPSFRAMMHGLGLTLLVVGMMSARLVIQPAGGGQTLPHKEATATGIPVVRVQTVVLEPIAESFEAVGSVRSRTTTVLSSKVVSYAREVLVREGDRVKAGQPMILLDDRDLAAQLRRAEAALEEAQSAADEVEKAIAAAEAARVAAAANKQFADATLRRYRLMLEHEAVSPQEFDAVLAKQQAAQAELARAGAMIKALQAQKRQVLAKIAQAKAEMANAQISLEYTTIRAPIDAVVLERKVEAGMLAAPGVPLLVIEDPRVYRLEVYVPESLLGDITLGMQVTTGLEALGRTELVGTVAEIVPTADPASRTFVVKIDLPSVAALRSGMYGKARFPKGERLAVLLPRSALVERGQLQSVYVVEEGEVARLRLVNTGKIYDDRMEMLSGLQVGDKVIVEGVDRLVDGVTVEVKDR